MHSSTRRPRRNCGTGRATAGAGPPGRLRHHKIGPIVRFKISHGVKFHVDIVRTSNPGAADDLGLVTVRSNRSMLATSLILVAGRDDMAFRSFDYALCARTHRSLLGRFATTTATS